MVALRRDIFEHILNHKEFIYRNKSENILVESATIEYRIGLF